jgi:hypothetical protein
LIYAWWPALLVINDKKELGAKGGRAVEVYNSMKLELINGGMTEAQSVA